LFNGRREKQTLAEEVLAELKGLLHERLAADQWGRLLVGVARAEDGVGWRVVSLDVENIFGNEAEVDRAFGQRGPVDVLPVLAQATEALAQLADVDLDQTGGGTLLRGENGELAWLPGLVAMPSETLERERETWSSQLLQQHTVLPIKLSLVTRTELALETGTAILYDLHDRMLATAAFEPIGSYSYISHSWFWAWANPSVPEALRQRCKQRIDNIVTRGLWEVSTPQFATDESTCGLLGAFVVTQSSAQALLRIPQPAGSLYVALFEVKPVRDLNDSSSR